MWERGAPTIMIKLLQADHGFFGRARIQWERRYEFFDGAGVLHRIEVVRYR